jgi:hypothetical protein
LFKEGLQRYADELEIYILQGQKDYAGELKEVRELMKLLDNRLAPAPPALDSGEIF